MRPPVGQSKSQPAPEYLSSTCVVYMVGLCLQNQRVLNLQEAMLIHAYSPEWAPPCRSRTYTVHVHVCRCTRFYRERLLGRLQYTNETVLFMRLHVPVRVQLLVWAGIQFMYMYLCLFKQRYRNLLSKSLTVKASNLRVYVDIHVHVLAFTQGACSGDYGI